MAHLRSATGLKRLAPGYESDLSQLFGADEWRAAAALAKTAATDAYLDRLRSAGPVELVAAAFILYGALVIGGGKSTQKRVKRVIPRCDHVLFDVSDDMRVARRKFKNCFTQIAKDHAGVEAVAPEHADELVEYAATYMDGNNAVVLSIRCIPTWLYALTAAVVAAGAAVAIARRRRA